MSMRTPRVRLLRVRGCSGGEQGLALRPPHLALLHRGALFHFAGEEAGAEEHAEAEAVEGEGEAGGETGAEEDEAHEAVAAEEEEEAAHAEEAAAAEEGEEGGHEADEEGAHAEEGMEEEEEAEAGVEAEGGALGRQDACSWCWLQAPTQRGRTAGRVHLRRRCCCSLALHRARR